MTRTQKQVLRIGGVIRLTRTQKQVARMSQRGIFERTQPQSDEDRMIARFTERPQDRKARIARKRVDPFRALAIRKMFGWEA